MSTEVFVLGAAGYIGEGVALAFRRNGYKVHGLVRNEAKAKQLLRNEIQPILASVEDVKAYKDILIRCSIVVDAVGFGDTSELFLKVVEDAANVRNSQDAQPLYKVPSLPLPLPSLFLTHFSCPALIHLHLWHHDLWQRSQHIN
jgi:hypothetical protein